MYIYIYIYFFFENLFFIVDFSNFFFSWYLYTFLFMKCIFLLLINFDKLYIFIIIKLFIYVKCLYIKIGFYTSISIKKKNKDKYFSFFF